MLARLVAAVAVALALAIAVGIAAVAVGHDRWGTGSKIRSSATVQVHRPGAL